MPRRKRASKWVVIWVVLIAGLLLVATIVVIWWFSSIANPLALVCEDVPDPGKVVITSWSGGSKSLATVSWPASGKWGESVVHRRVNYLDENGQNASMDVLCGIESDLGMPTDFRIEPRSGYDGPTLLLENGFAFITFQWPLIWMKNIDAGSVGTTAIMRRTSDELQVFLIRNAKESLTNQNPTTDCNTTLRMYPVSSVREETIAFKAVSRWDVVMIRHKEVGSDFEPIGTGTGSSYKRTRWFFDVTKNAKTGALTVTPEDSGENDAAVFLKMVLEIGRCQGLYVVPANCP